MGIPLSGKAHFTWTDSGSFLHSLTVPLQRVRPAFSLRQWTRDSLSFVNRETWYAGSVHEIVADIRYDEDAQSLIDLLLAGAKGLTITYDDGYVSHPCYLIAPVENTVADFDDFQQSEDWHRVEIRLRRTDGAAFDQAVFSDPVLFRLSSAQAQSVFTRSGTVGPFTDVHGVLQGEVADEQRWDWVDLDEDGVFETKTLLLEGARTNLNDVDDLTTWSVSGTPVVTGSVSDPAGGTAAYSVEDDDGGTAEAIVRALTGFDNLAANTVVFVVRENTMPASGNQALRLRDSTAAATRLNLDISGWVNGEPTVAASTGTFLGKRYAGNGYWELYGQTTAALVEANTNQVQIIPASTAAETGEIDVYRINAYAGITPAASILDQSEVQAVETWYAPFAHPPREMTIYAKFILWTDPLITEAPSPRIVHIGNAANDNARFLLYKPGGTDSFGCAYNDGIGGGELTSTVDINPSFMDTIEVRGELRADGSIQVGAAKNDGAESLGTASAASSLPPTYSDTRLYLNSVGATSHTGLGFIAVKVHTGLKSMAFMRAV